MNGWSPEYALRTHIVLYDCMMPTIIVLEGGGWFARLMRAPFVPFSPGIYFSILPFDSQE